MESSPSALLENPPASKFPQMQVGGEAVRFDQSPSRSLLEVQFTAIHRARNRLSRVDFSLSRGSKEFHVGYIKGTPGYVVAI